MIENVNAVTKKGLTALMTAAVNNHLDVVVSLMNHPGINLNVQGDKNMTALHVAVHKDRLAILAQLLSDHRIDTSLKDYFNGRKRTPLKLAKELGSRDECVKILREHGAPEE